MMKFEKAAALGLAAALAVSVLAGCGAAGQNEETRQTVPNPTPPPRGDGLFFYPGVRSIPAQEVYEYPYMGLTAMFDAALTAQLKTGEVMLLPSAEYSPDRTFDYAALCWYVAEGGSIALGEENDAVKFLPQIGVLGVYKKTESLDLDTLTGCSEHKTLGESPDGRYVYVLSLSDKGGEDRKEALSRTEITISEIMKPGPMQAVDAFAEARVETDNIGDIQTMDVNGNEITAELFRESELTLVNVFTTWCPNCIEEMPDLEKVKQDLASRGVNVVAVVADSVDQAGNVREDIVSLAQTLQKQANLTIPLLIPDKTDMNGRLKGIQAVPESFFVDKEGNLVGETYVGAKSYEVWMEIAQKELEQLKEEQ